MGSQTGGRCCDSVRLSQRLSERHMIQVCSHSHEEKSAHSNTNLLSAPHILLWAAELQAPTIFGSFTWLMMLFKPDGRRPTAGKQVRLQWLPHVILLRYSPLQEEEMFHLVHIYCAAGAPLLSVVPVQFIEAPPKESQTFQLKSCRRKTPNKGIQVCLCELQSPIVIKH